MEHAKTIALVPILDGEPQLPIFVGTEEDAEQYWEDNPLNFLNRRVDTWDVCPCCMGAYPELTHQLYNSDVCENCHQDYHEPTFEEVLGRFLDNSPELEPCEHCGAGTYHEQHACGLTLCAACATNFDGLVDSPDYDLSSSDVGTWSDVGTCRCCKAEDQLLTAGFCDGCYDHMPEELTGKGHDDSQDDELPF